VPQRRNCPPGQQWSWQINDCIVKPTSVVKGPSSIVSQAADPRADLLGALRKGRNLDPRAGIRRSVRTKQVCLQQKPYVDEKGTSYVYRWDDTTDPKDPHCEGCPPGQYYDDRTRKCAPLGSKAKAASVPAKPISGLAGILARRAAIKPESDSEDEDAAKTKEQGDWDTKDGGGTAGCVQVNATPSQFYHSNVAHLNDTGNREFRYHHHPPIGRLLEPMTVWPSAAAATVGGANRTKYKTRPTCKSKRKHNLLIALEVSDSSVGQQRTTHLVEKALNGFSIHYIKRSRSTILYRVHKHGHALERKRILPDIEQRFGILDPLDRRRGKIKLEARLKGVLLCDSMGSMLRLYRSDSTGAVRWSRRERHMTRHQLLTSFDRFVRQ
jgi:hypothetical protein